MGDPVAHGEFFVGRIDHLRGPFLRLQFRVLQLVEWPVRLLAHRAVPEGPAFRPLLSFVDRVAFQQRLIDLAQELRFSRVVRLPIERTRLGAGHPKPLLRAGDSHIAEPAFFFQSVRPVKGTPPRKQPVFHARHENKRELQALCAVQRHQNDCVLVGIVVVHFGEKRDPFHELSQGNIRIFFFVIVNDGFEFHQVLDAALRLEGVLVFQRLQISGSDEQSVVQIGDLHVILLFAEGSNHIRESGDARRGFCRKRPDDVAVHQHVKETLLPHAGQRLQFVERLAADAALRFVDDPHEGQIVRPVLHQPHVAHHVLDLFAVVVAEPAQDPVRDSSPRECLFKGP